MSIDGQIALIQDGSRFGNGTFPLDRADFADDGAAALFEVLRSGRWSMFTSPSIEEFELIFAKYVGAKHVVMVNSCTTALLASFSAVGVKIGSNVASPAFTYIGSALPAATLGATITWLDRGLNDDAIDVEGLRASINCCSLDAVVFPALFGSDAGFESVAEICNQYKVPLVIDCAQFLGDRERTAKMIEAGPCCFSFGESKILRIGEGGAIATNSDDIAEKVRLFRHEGEVWTKSGLSRVAMDQVSPSDVLSGLATARLGLNLRPLAISASIGISQLGQLTKFLTATEKNAQALLQALKTQQAIKLPENRSVWWTFPLEIVDDSVDRSVLLAALLAEGVPAGVHFPNLLPAHPLFSMDSIDVETTFPNAHQFSSRHIVLPIYPRLTVEHMHLISDAVTRILSSPLLRLKSTKHVAEKYLKEQRMQELSSGLYMFTKFSGDL